MVTGMGWHSLTGRGLVKLLRQYSNTNKEWLPQEQASVLHDMRRSIHLSILTILVSNWRENPVHGYSNSHQRSAYKRVATVGKTANRGPLSGEPVIITTTMYEGGILPGDTE